MNKTEIICLMAVIAAGILLGAIFGKIFLDNII